jgi:methionyl-tRNA synthetase
MEEKETEQLYDETAGQFLADRYVVGVCPECGYDKARGDECPRCAASYEATDLKSPVSKVSGRALILQRTKHYYLQFQAFQKDLSRWLSQKPWKEGVLRFAKSYVDRLQPRAITRDGVWGVPVPDRGGKVFYVWFDAPIGYLSITQEWGIHKHQDPDRWLSYWCDPDVRLVQFLGKDNIPFHAVFFPAMLMGQSRVYKLPDFLPANEFLLLEGKPFSKSDGWTIDIDCFLSRYSVDQIRYMLSAHAPETGDTEFKWDDFQQRCNADLVGKLGNFVHRTLTFIQTRGQAHVPAIPWEDEGSFAEGVKQVYAEGLQCYRQFSLKKAAQKLMELATLGNVYFDATKPWTIGQEPSSQRELGFILKHCLECIRYLALLASPMMPQASQRMWEFLGFRGSLASLTWKEALGRTWTLEKLPVPTPLFRKVEDEEMQEEKTKLEATHTRVISEMGVTPVKPTVSFETFQSVDLRVGRILEAKRVVKSKKLLDLLVDLGFAKRRIVSGIFPSYQPEDLVGKSCLVVANLPTAKLMGIESEGMILAGSLDCEGLELLFAQSLPAGSVVK